MSFPQTELEMTPSIRFYPKPGGNLLGTRIQVTTQMPDHYERPPITFSCVLSMFEKSKKFPDTPGHRFAIEASSVNDPVIQEFLERVQKKEQEYWQYYARARNIQALIDTSFTYATSLAWLELLHHPWSIAVGDGVVLRTEFNWLYEPLGTITKLEILERLESS
ncbi:MAG TPA: hypothetical protein VFM68_02650 [Candidatus Saccharimonadales bacterium]|nr:hypothetical protein [Candidatus Saccharimonadales bacterium]